MTISSFSIATARRVSARKAGIAEARKVSPSPTPATSGHSLRAPTSWSGCRRAWRRRRSGRAARRRRRGPRRPGRRRSGAAIRWATTSASVSELNSCPSDSSRARSLAWFSTIPLRTMWTRSELSLCGWAFSSVTRPWVAQRVWATPVVAGGRRDGDATAPRPARPSRRAGWRGCRPRARCRPGRPRSPRRRPSHSRGTRASPGRRPGGRGRGAPRRIRRFRT